MQLRPQTSRYNNGLQTTWQYNKMAICGPLIGRLTPMGRAIVTDYVKNRLQINGLLVSMLATLAFAQTGQPGSALPSSPPPTLPPIQLVRKTAWNEIKAARDPSSRKFMFRSRKQTARGSQTRLYVETKDGMAGLLVANNDRPLTPKERQAEEERVARFIHDPGELQKKRRREKEDSDRILQIMKALPDAFIYERDGLESGRQGIGKPGDELIRLKFRPNPKYDPPSRTEQVLTGMRGHILIDANSDRIAMIDGTLFKDVTFGWGILGHLDRGGHFLVEQGDAGDGEWEITRMDLSFTGKIMMFKSLRIQSDEVYSDFRPVPADLTFAQGLEMLKKQEAELAENHHQNGDGK
jgi:hypothetical protein